jgi:hypothetical protein
LRRGGHSNFHASTAKAKRRQVSRAIVSKVRQVQPSPFADSRHAFSSTARKTWGSRVVQLRQADIAHTAPRDDFFAGAARHLARARQRL